MKVDHQMNTRFTATLDLLARQPKLERTICLTVISRKWWLVLLKGAWAIVLASLVFTSGVSVMWDLALVFSALAFVDGLTELPLGTRSVSGLPWRAMIGLGWFEIFAGAVPFFRLGASINSLLFFVGAWALGAGILTMLAAVRVPDLPGEYLLFISGLVTFVLGFLLFTRSGTSLRTTVELVTVYLSVSGILTMALSFRLRGLRLK